MNYLKNDFFQKIIVPKIKELDFDNKNLEELPPLGTFKNLFRLQANNNQLKKLPVLPPSLKYLSIRNNQISHLPSKLPDKLITLDFSNNNIYKLPKTLPKDLKIIICNNNHIKFISLSHHTSLLRFDSIGNYINFNTLVKNLPNSLLVYNKEPLYIDESIYGLRPIYTIDESDVDIEIDD